MAVVGTPMPSTMQQSMVRSRPTMVALPASWTMALIRMEARPVTVMQPAMMPAMAQATATVTAPLAPASRASMPENKVCLPEAATAEPKSMAGSSPRPCTRMSTKLMKPTMTEARMDTAAA